MAKDDAMMPATATQELNKNETHTIDDINKPSIAATGKDKAAELLDSNPRITVTAEESSRILRKIDLIILPILLSVHFPQSLDKTTLSYASVFGLIENAHLNPNSDQYFWLGSIVYFAQLVMQPVVAVLLVKLKIGKLMGAMVFVWGVTLCGMADAKSFGGLMATRFLLGCFEAAIAPAFIALYSMLGLVNIFGSLLPYGLGHIKSPVLHSYRIIFLFCGLLTALVSIAVFIFMPDSPMEAKFPKEDEKLVAVERLRMNQMGVASRVWKWDHVKEAFLDVETWLWFSMLTAVSIRSGGITIFGPLIIQSFGFGSFATILFNMPFGAVQIIATLGGAWLATRLKRKAPVLILLCIPPIIGISVLLAVGREKKNRGVLLLGYYLTSIYLGISPLIYSWYKARKDPKMCTHRFPNLESVYSRILP